MTICLNPIRWLDVTAHSQRDIQFSQCVRSWGGDDCVILISTLERACTMTPDELWNEPKAVKARTECRRDGVASWCAGCPRLATGRSPTQSEPEDAPDHWTRINLAYDRTCNLACPSCRPMRWAHGPAHQEMLIKFQERFIKPLLFRAEWAYLAGLGDPFGSPAYRTLLRELTPAEAPGLHWHIQTNGLGFTADEYLALPTRAQISSVQVSIDAARPATYRTNRGGNWQRLRENLEFLSGLRASGAVAYFAISFVFQSNNWREMSEFVDLGRELGVDLVLLNALLDQGSYPPGEYARRAVHLPSHPDYVVFSSELSRLASEPGVSVEMPRGGALC